MWKLQKKKYTETGDDKQSESQNREQQNALRKCKRQSYTRLPSAHYRSECSMKPVHSWKSLLNDTTDNMLTEPFVVLALLEHIPSSHRDKIFT